MNLHPLPRMPAVLPRSRGARAASTVEHPATGTAASVRPEDLYEVILFNDDVNSMEHVVECLMRVFGHPLELAVKIMLEAHETGRAIAELESETPARLHKDQLTAFGLTAEIQKI